MRGILEMAKKLPITTIVQATLDVATDKGVRKALFGVYSDNTPRSLVDCIHGEILSPKDREKYVYKKKSKKKKGKKKSVKFDY